ncbi:hypothetical protein DL89DRAFT_257939 [Linderina pennispora]|uniref:HCP-like protein n=1 Tax=Linderina pennispora TaxID=61395 RepID=A0A1Y1W976_9FUNG|nr:uncharacterized protein DL89DRAFT_257939 [Linderina pennispora]ORX69714.1 hypothetical protein DL89DRAFT_257939 [Linderina pennispora]
MASTTFPSINVQATQAMQPTQIGPKSPIGWWEIPRYSTWDLGNKYACSQSTLVGRRSQETPEKPSAVPSALPTVYPRQSTDAESRVSFSNSVNELPRMSIVNDFGMGLDADMGRAHRLPTLLHNPDLIAKYHAAAKMTEDKDVQYEFARQLLLCGSPDLADLAAELKDMRAESRLVMEGVYWMLRLASKNKHVDASFMVARWYELGKYGCPVNKKKAQKYYLVAVRAGHKAAGYHLGCMYEAQKKVRKARECFETSSKKGFSLATYRLGMAYLSGTLGVTADFSMACSFLRESLFHATHPVADAGYHLAVALIQLPSFDRHMVSEPHLYLKRAWLLGHCDAGALLRDILK